MPEHRGPANPLRWPDAAPAHGDIHLRPFDPRDVPMLLDLSTDPYVPLVGSLPPNTDVEGALAYIDRQHDRLATGAGFSFCVARDEGDDAVGQAGLWLASREQGRATAGYCIAPAARGHGFAGQALHALTDVAWTLPEIWRVERYVEPWNAASLKTAAAAGYAAEGTLRSHQVIGGRRVDMVILAALRPDPS